MKRTSLALTGALALALCATAASAQSGGPDAAGYTYATVPFQWIEASTLPGHQTIGASDDVVYGSYALPFTFTFYGTAYTTFNVSSNGFLTFGTNNGNSYCCSGQVMPTTGAPVPMIAAGWTDLYPDTINFGASGTAPNRRFVVQWIASTYYYNAAIQVQVQLEEGTNAVYVNLKTLNADSYHVTTTGIQNANGTVGLTAFASATATHSNLSLVFSPFAAHANGPYSVTEGNSVTLTGSAVQGTPPYTASWDLNNDGTFETSGASPTVPWFAFGGMGSRPVTLRVVDGAGRVSTSGTTVNVVNVAPTVSWSATPSTGNGFNRSPVQFGISGTDPGVGQETYTGSWNFGDGTPVQTGMAATHTFVEPGTYTVVATVDDGNGGVTSSSDTYVVQNRPPSVTVNPGTAPETNAGTFSGVVSSVSPYNTSQGFDVTWDFGDGTPTVTGHDLTSVNHTYLAAGSYTMTVTAVDARGGTTTSTGTATITNIPPVVSLAPAAGDEGSPTVFAAQASHPSPPKQAAGFDYAWDFGDGTPVLVGHDLPTPAHVYDDGGVYVVTLVVTDVNGYSTTVTNIATIANVPPHVTLTQVSASPAGTASSFTATVTSPSNADMAAGHTLVWNFGDGTSATQSTTNGQGVQTHSYCRAGTFTVTVSALDKDGLTASAFATAQVTNTAPTITTSAPTAAREDVTLSYLVGVQRPSCEPVTFAVQGPTGMVISPTGLLSWTPVFADVGSHPVTVTVSDSFGGQAVQTFAVNVRFKDADHDGLPDTWEAQHGLDTEDPQTPFENPSGDGISNQEKYGDDLDPAISLAPGAITVTAPADGATVASTTPTLEVSGPTGATRQLDYAFEVYADPALTELLPEASGTVSGTGAASFTLPVALADHFTYYWRARAIDGVSKSPWTATSHFTLDAVANPPGAPTPVSPVAGTTVSTLAPKLVIADGQWIRGGTVTWHFEVYSDAALTSLVAEGDGITQGNGLTSFTVEGPLTNGSWYHWRARGTSGADVGEYGPVSTFRVLEAASPLVAPQIASPLDGSVVRSVRPTLIATNAGDPDNRALTYTFTLDTTPTLDSATAITSPAIPAGGAYTAWTPELDLSADQTWYWGVTVTDGTTTSPRATASFRINPENDAPAVPGTSSAEVNGDVIHFTASESSDVDADAITYDFEVLAAADGPVVGRRSAQEQPATTLEVGMLPDSQHTFVWRVRAVDVHGAASGWSDPAELTIPAAPVSGCTAAFGSMPFFALGLLAPLLRRRRRR